jgi:hypothetical protein
MEPGSDRPVIHRARFRPQEDRALGFLVAQYGVRDWRLIARHLPGRTGRQCRDRWNHYLAAEALERSWTPDEDARLWQAAAEHGPRWDRVAEALAPRTPMQVHQRWLALRSQAAKASAFPYASARAADSSPVPRAMPQVPAAGERLVLPHLPPLGNAP